MCQHSCSVCLHPPFCGYLQGARLWAAPWQPSKKQEGGALYVCIVRRSENKERRRMWPRVKKLSSVRSIPYCCCRCVTRRPIPLQTATAIYLPNLGRVALCPEATELQMRIAERCAM